MALHQFPAFYIFIRHQQSLSASDAATLTNSFTLHGFQVEAFQARKTSKTNFILYIWTTLQSHLIPPLCQLHNWELKQAPGTVHNSPFILLFLCLKNGKKTEDNNQIHFHIFLTIHSAPLSLTKASIFKGWQTQARSWRDQRFFSYLNKLLPQNLLSGHSRRLLGNEKRNRKQISNTFSVTPCILNFRA